jgi:aspartate 1-decarboxylase
MMLTLMKCKLHGATVTGADINYEGSIGIPRDLMDAAGLLPHEKVDVLNFRNGARLTTYVLEYPKGSGEIVINGPAAHLVSKGDKVIVVAYAHMEPKKAKKFEPTVVILGAHNKIKPARGPEMIDPKRGKLAKKAVKPLKSKPKKKAKR